MQEFPLVSIVIPTLNCPENLKECLESIKNQTYSNIEVIVVDGHSTDNTPGMARNFGADVYSFGPKQSKALINVCYQLNEENNNE